MVVCIKAAVLSYVSVAIIVKLHSEEESPVFIDKHLIQELKELRTEHDYKEEEEHVTFDEQPLFISEVLSA